MGNNPSTSQWRDFPVTNISWTDGQSFISELSLITGKMFRLPTEAEWEFAARGGEKSKGFYYSGSKNISTIWCNEQGLGSVARFSANELGIFDMSGNVWEFCQDKYGKYSKKEQYNPITTEGNHHVIRGGSFCSNGLTCRVSSRNMEFGIALNDTGFRLAISL